MSHQKSADFVQIPLLNGLKCTFKSNPALSIASFGLIIAINLVTPLSFIWLFYRLYLLYLNPTKNVTIYASIEYLKYLLTIYASIEVFYYFYKSYLIKKAQKKTKIPKISFIEIEKLINRYFDVLLSNTNKSNASDLMATFFEKWSFNTPYNKIGIENIINWVSFVFLGKNSNELNHKQSMKLKEIILTVLNKHNVQYNEGNNKNVNFMHPFLYEIDIKRRPWIYYFVTDTILSNLGHIILTTKKMGYVYKKKGVLSYWVYSPLQQSILSPIIFFHGIGSGILMYIPFLMNIHLKYSNRTIIIINISCISMRYPTINCDEIENMENTLNSIKLILKEENIENRMNIYIGHSFGTMIVCWILNDDSFLIKQCILIDPICFKLYEADITYNFVYRKPMNVAQLFMWYFVCREFGIALVIGRHFWWFTSMIMLDKENKKPNSNLIKVFLSENDCIINVKSVQQYLKSYGVQYYIAKHHVHGSFLLNKSSWNQLSQWI